MQIVSDTKTERHITVTWTEKELREIQWYAEYYRTNGAGSNDASAAAERLRSRLDKLILGHRDRYLELFNG